MTQEKIDITLSDAAIKRVCEVAMQSQNHGKFLRIGVSSGGCSGFQYLFNLDDKLNPDDIKLYEKDSQVLAVVDESAVPFLQGCEIDFVNDLGASYFKVNNPNAVNSCGCGASFSV
ncbi:MAG TPA: iron-sulfur cluster assembly accessory protein [Rickettsiales bacterium]|nr:iron-sulfur cluster assembly accessory protein [Rickettsiales bacterium]